MTQTLQNKFLEMSVDVGLKGVFKYRIMPSRTRDNVTSFPVKMTFSFSLDKRNVLYRTSDTIINGSGESRQIKTGSGFFLQKVYFSYRTFAS